MPTHRDDVAFRVLYDPFLDENVDMDEAAQLKAAEEAGFAGIIHEADTGFSIGISLEGEPDALRDLWWSLMEDLQDVPVESTDTMYDYWPSGIRLARQMARALDGDDAAKPLESELDTFVRLFFENEDAAPDPDELRLTID